MLTTTSISNQVKVTLPSELYLLTKNKASSFGLSLSAYLRHLALNDVKKDSHPVFPASAMVEKSYKQALKESSKTVAVSDINEYFDQL